MTEELLRQIDAWAADHEINRAEAIRRLVRQGFLRLEDDQ